MKSLFSIIALCVAVLSASAASRITATITVTNAPTTNGMTLTVNGDTRTWTNVSSALTIATNTTIGGSATNLYRHLTTNTFSGPVVISQPTSNTVQLVGSVGQSMSVLAFGGWGTNSYATQTVTAATAIRVPMSVEAPTNQTNFASQLISDLSGLSTNKFATNSVALSNYPNRYEVTNILNASVGSKLDATNGTAFALIATNASFINGTNIYGTNGYFSNLVASNFIATNAFITNATVSNLVTSNLAVREYILLNGTNILTNKISVTFGLNSNTATTTNIAHVLSNLFNAIQNHKLIVIP